MKPSDLRKLQIRLLRDYDEESIDGLYHAVQSSEAEAKRRATSRIEQIKNESELTESEKNEYADMAGDDVYEAEVIRRVGEEMVVVALYRTVEITIKKILNRSGLFSEGEQRQFYKIGRLKESVERHVVDMESLNGFSAYDELRCINNCIKHEGKVNGELAAYRAWRQGQPLEGLWGRYQQLKPNVRQFVTQLSEEVMEKIT